MNGRRAVSISIAAVLSMALLAMGCGGPTVHQLQSGERTAGAEGQLEVTTDDNGNAMVEMSVAHLPPPSNLAEDRSIYVVWISPEDADIAYAVGKIRLNEDRTGALRFTTPFEDFQMVVTAEPDIYVENPSSEIVLRHGT